MEELAAIPGAVENADGVKMLSAEVRALKLQMQRLDASTKQDLLELRGAVDNLHTLLHDQLLPSAAAAARQSGKLPRKSVCDPLAHAVPIIGAVADSEGTTLGTSANDIEHELLEYTLSESMWDAGILVGFGSHMPCQETALLICGLILNFFIQGCFVMVVLANMANPDIPNIDQLRSWRATVGHDLQYADKLAKVPLISKLCSRSVSLQSSGMQMTLYGDLQGFLAGNRPGMEVFSGIVLANLSLLLWAFIIYQDVFSNYQFFQAITRQPTGQPELTATEQGQLKVGSMSITQKFLIVLFVCLPRLIISCALCVVGAVFLAYTSNMEELLLNTVALEFILQIDETLYPVILPRRTRCIFASLAPMETSLTWMGRRGTVAVLCRYLLVAVSLVIMNVCVIVPFRQSLEDAATMLCGGNRDFVVTQNLATGGLHYFNTSTYDVTGKGQEFGSSLQDAVLLLSGLEQRLTGVERLGALNLTRKSGSWTVLESIMQGGTLAGVAFTECIDYTDATAIIFTSKQQASLLKEAGMNITEDPLQSYYFAKELLPAVLRSLNDSISGDNWTCKDVPFELCNMYEATTLRSLCQESCGCNNAWQGQFFATPAMGCSPACFKGTGATYANSLDLKPKSVVSFDLVLNETALMNCEDQNTTSLLHAGSFKNYARGVYNFLLESRSSVDEANLAKHLLLSKGCLAVPNIRRILRLSICDQASTSELSLGRSVRPWCPRTCDCGYLDAADCPAACNERGDIPRHGDSSHTYTPAADFVQAVNHQASMALSFDVQNVDDLILSQDFALSLSWERSLQAAIVNGSGFKLLPEHIKLLTPIAASTELVVFLPSDLCSSDAQQLMSPVKMTGLVRQSLHDIKGIEKIMINKSAHIIVGNFSASVITDSSGMDSCETKEQAQTTSRSR
eukprot:TRINITY_DN33848_c0_g1_i1.p1 TRINITY_DN33848_c0_g1~~TRINITY_DN33848_c0_g1_i1.p1  ORF type:complete len:911 (-),score=147.19 TRINITY_DN33848_c0_g1_i1:62-2794(-)